LDRVDGVPEDKKLMVHCQAGGRASVASALLQRQGYEVTLIDDNFENYRSLVTE
jgi:hydroxyacylglutathione hydrolase